MSNIRATLSSGKSNSKTSHREALKTILILKEIFFSELKRLGDRWKPTEVSTEHVTSLVRNEDYSKPETGMKLVANIS
jgi:hypothetical protein